MYMCTYSMCMYMGLKEFGLDRKHDCPSIPTIFPPPLPSHYRLMNVVLGVHSTHHIHRASLTDSLSANEGVWSFLRLVGVCPRDMSTIMLGPFTDR